MTEAVPREAVAAPVRRWRLGGVGKGCSHGVDGAWASGGEGAVLTAGAGGGGGGGAGATVAAWRCRRVSALPVGAGLAGTTAARPASFGLRYMRAM